MRSAEEINQLIKKIHLKASADLDKRVRERISKAPAELEKKKSAHIQPNIWRNIMKNRMIKLTAAAIVIIAILAGLPFLSNSSSGVVLADVLAKVEQARAFMYKMAVE
jgi:hypothetical protein